jgi:ectoine hydroxylase-related dioxygenase (phytanoyl-CoA dioxygenase family)
VKGLEDVLSAAGPIGAIGAHRLGVGAKPVRAVVFDKTQSINWSLGWHQDRTIIVERRLEVVGFGPWSLKDSLVHVEPPITLLNDMVTLRVHLDEVGPDNAPLKIARGSHRLGRIPGEEIPRVVQSRGSYSCLAEAGDVWVYATPIVHASGAAMSPHRRRVLQVDYAAFDLPGALRWRGI